MAARLLGLWVRIASGTWMSVCCECCVLSGRGLSNELITRPEESYRLWCVVVCDLETSWMKHPWPTRDCRAKKQTLYLACLCWVVENRLVRNSYHWPLARRCSFSGGMSVPWTGCFVTVTLNALPVILVRNQSRDMLGGETGKITFGKLSINLGLRGKWFPSWYNIGTSGGCGLQGCRYWSSVYLPLICGDTLGVV